MVGDRTFEMPDMPVGIPGGQTPESLERDAQALRMIAMGYSQGEVSDALGYGGQPNVSRALKRAQDKILRTSVDTWVAVELAKLDAYALRFIGILHKRHLVVSHGKIMRDDQNGTELVDDAPEMAALRELVKISESRRKLLGLDAAAKLDVNVEHSEVDAELVKLVQAMESNGRAREQRVKRGES